MGGTLRNWVFMQKKRRPDCERMAVTAVPSPNAARHSKCWNMRRDDASSVEVSQVPSTTLEPWSYAPRNIQTISTLQQHHILCVLTISVCPVTVARKTHPLASLMRLFFDSAIFSSVFAHRNHRFKCFYWNVIAVTARGGLGSKVGPGFFGQHRSSANLCVTFIRVRLA